MYKTLCVKFQKEDCLGVIFLTPMMFVLKPVIFLEFDKIGDENKC